MSSSDGLISLQPLTNTVYDSSSLVFIITFYICLHLLWSVRKYNR